MDDSINQQKDETGPSKDDRTVPVENPLKTKVGHATEPTRERYAHSIALVIVWTFAAAVALLIGLVYWVVLKYPGIDGCGNIKDCKLSYRAVALLTEAAAPALKEFGSFISTVFGSLLAFVLGYYFGEQKHSS